MTAGQMLVGWLAINGTLITGMIFGTWLIIRWRR